MSKQDRRKIFVYTHWKGMREPCLVGRLYAEQLRGKEIFSFEYDNNWLKEKNNFLLDPDLQFYNGLQYLNDTEKQNFGVFLDSSPDRWGRFLMQRREVLQARKDSRPIKSLFETDYLLGVYDRHRMGGLRFKLEKEGPFLNDDKQIAAPPWTSLRELEQITIKVDNDEKGNDKEQLRWINMLIAPGSSLGGACPKASVLHPDGSLWIAKFPSRNDTTDIGAWEMVANVLAKESGISMALCMANKYSDRHHTFLTRRFDRQGSERIHFASAMTMLGYTDGHDHAMGVSYLELAAFIINNGKQVKEDLEQLFRRIVFNICISNTDDHLRNHGFIMQDNHWRLSPAYDINPNENGAGLSLNINEKDNTLDLDLAMDIHKYFQLAPGKAKSIIAHIVKSVSNWKKVAKQYGIDKTGIDMKSPAFTKAKGLKRNKLYI